MANKDEIYVSVDLEQYKKNKSNILASQVDIIGAIKHLRNMSQILQEEKNLKIKLQELFSSVKEDLEMLEDSVPTSTLPKSVRERTIQLPKEDFELDSETPINENPEEPNILDLELQEIQDKLEQLNH